MPKEPDRSRGRRKNDRSAVIIKLWTQSETRHVILANTTIPAAVYNKAERPFTETKVL